MSRALKLADLWHLARLPVSDRHFDEIAEAAATLKAVRPPKPCDFENALNAQLTKLPFFKSKSDAGLAE